MTELGGSLGESGDTARALALLREWARLEPDRPLTHMVFGFTHQRAGDLKSAREAYAKAAELNPWDHVPLMRLASVHVELSDFVRAERLLEDVIRLDRSKRPGASDAGAPPRGAGERSSALTRLDKALAFAPTDQGVLELRQQLQKSR